MATHSAVLILVLVVLVSSTRAVFVPGQSATAASPLWVNDLAYGARGGGFYWDAGSNQVWTAERDWHYFAPQPPRVATPLWVNQLDYGSVGGGFYWDPLSGLVWTAERGWHRYSPGGAAPPPGMVSCVVSSVIDGDTIDVTGCADAGRIRLLLVDSPESGQDCYASESTAHVRSRLLGATVSLERDQTNVDQYGRYLRYAWIGGELFNETMVRDGVAKVLAYENVKYLARLNAAEAEARAAGRGLWGACGTGNCAGPIRITGLDKVAEVVTITGSGSMTGWRLVSERGAATQRFDFPSGFVLSGSVQVVSATPAFTNTANRLWWTAVNVWNNSDDDDALLYDASGQLVCEFDDGE